MSDFILKPGRWKLVYRDKPSAIVESDGTGSVNLDDVWYVIALGPEMPEPKGGN
jgi:hypothetical protein